MSEILGWMTPPNPHPPCFDTKRKLNYIFAALKALIFASSHAQTRVRKEESSEVVRIPPCDTLLLFQVFFYILCMERNSSSSVGCLINYLACSFPLSEYLFLIFLCVCLFFSHLANVSPFFSGFLYFSSCLIQATMFISPVIIISDCKVGPKS
jgi:hypothetical protein